MKVSYEWDYETVDEHGDVIEHSHADKLSQFSEGDKTNTLALVRDVISENNGLEQRAWAYVKDGALPEYFKDASGSELHKVPSRFHKELKNYLK